MNIVIFSRNRPAQLDALLTSLKLNMVHGYEGANISVIFKDDMLGAPRGYLRLFKDTEQYGPALHKGINLKYQMDDSNFRDLVLSSIDESHELTMFLVDDIVFKGEFSIHDFAFQLVKDAPKTIICTSLRLWKGINHCYPTNSPSPAPKFSKLKDDTLVFNWVNQSGDWGYPMSVDGHVYRTDFILRVTRALQFSNPNVFEGNMAQLVGMGVFSNLPTMVCYESESKLVNNPLNRVQDVAQNRCGNETTAEEINKRFLLGERIDVSVYQGVSNAAPHTEMPIKWRTTNVDQRATREATDQATPCV